MRRAAAPALAALFTLATLGATALLLLPTGHPWLLPSLGGSCVILFGMPDSEMARPRSFVGGHVLSTVIGLALVHFGADRFGGGAIWSFAAVAVSLALMMLTRTIHSPAGANPLVILAEHAGWSFLVDPLAIGLMVLFAAGWLFTRFRWRAPGS